MLYAGGSTSSKKASGPELLLDGPSVAKVENISVRTRQLGGKPRCAGITSWLAGLRDAPVDEDGLAGCVESALPCNPCKQPSVAAVALEPQERKHEASYVSGAELYVDGGVAQI